jgi:alpha-L-fucosidase
MPVGLRGELLQGHWYDTPGEITQDQSRQFTSVIRELQPDCLINSRVGHGFYDYISTGDNAVPARVFEADWEIPATLNHTWGYKENDHNWKDAGELIRLLVNINRKGGNYLLNIGPRADERSQIQASGYYRKSAAG